MPRIKRRIFAGAVCEQEVFTVADHKRNLKDAEPRERFKTEEERERHKWLMSRRHHARIVNENYGPQSLYSTLTTDNEHEVHTFEEARRVRDNYVRRLKYAFPDAKINIYMGRGKSTARIHFHMLSDGVPEETILKKWQAGTIVRVEHLREHNYYNGVDHGRDYTGLANYLFDHWTPEQGEGSHRWKQTKNVRQPEREEPSIIIRNYSENNPPRAPKGYKLVECKGNRFGYLCFKYIKEVEACPPYRKNKALQN